MNVLIITNLFPNSQEPSRGIFNFQQIKELSKDTEIKLKIIAPIPWMYYARIPYHESISGFEVSHPRYLVIPKLFRSLYGFFFYLGITREVKRIKMNFEFDCILATWAYPDAFASALIARKLKKPLIVKVHGSDINLYTKTFLRKAMIRYTLSVSSKIVAVTEHLKESILALGIPEGKVAVLKNGVDIERFSPMDKQQSLLKLGFEPQKRIILFIGNLVPIKGLPILLKAVSNLCANLQDLLLVIVGGGQEKDSLKKMVCDLNIEQVVKFVGQKTHDEIPLWLNTASVFCLPSFNEGCPNVILEALACGKPVVASNVGGIPEIVKSKEMGILVKPNNCQALTSALKEALEKTWDYEKIRQVALGYKWQENALQLRKIIDCSVKSFLKEKTSLQKKIFKSFLLRLLPKKLILQRLPAKNRDIALTFDDGPHPEFTPRLLTLLKEKGIKATFFVVGRQAEKHKELVLRIIKEGHSVGIHSYTHYKFSTLNYGVIKDEIMKSKKGIEFISGDSCRLFRPPQGFVTFRQLFYCSREKLTTVLWSVDSQDSRYKDSQMIFDAIVNQAIKAGDIILFHDDNEHTLQAIPELIEYLKKREFACVTVEEMLR